MEEYTMRIMKQIEISASADKVWKVFAHDFDRASQWMSSVPNSYGEDVGESFEGSHSAGRVCELDGDPNGIKASESFLAYDEAARTCTVNIDLVNAPALIPIRGNVLDFSLDENGPNKSTVKWVITPKLKPLAYVIAPLVKLGLGVFIGQITEELKYFIENGTPHPRKVKASNKMNKAQVAQSA
jgi:hypothetical protein